MLCFRIYNIRERIKCTLASCDRDPLKVNHFLSTSISNLLCPYYANGEGRRSRNCGVESLTFLMPRLFAVVDDKEEENEEKEWKTINSFSHYPHFLLFHFHRNSFGGDAID